MTLETTKMRISESLRSPPTLKRLRYPPSNYLTSWENYLIENLDSLYLTPKRRAVNKAQQLERSSKRMSSLAKKEKTSSLLKKT